MVEAGLLSSGIIAPFLVVLRESIEAALIVGIMWAYLDKIERPEYQKYLLYGSLAAIVSSIGLGGLIIITLGELSGFWEKAFEGVASITATIVLILAFVAVAREGLETVLFLTPLLSIDLGSTLVGSVLGLGVALALSLAAKRGIYNMDISKFFSYTSLILIIFAAGLFGYGIHELIEVAEVSGIESPLFEKAWDINQESKDHPLHEKGIVGSFAKALVGYDGNPEILRVMGYVIYWVIVGSYWRKTFRN